MPLIDETTELFSSLEALLGECKLPQIKLPLSAIKGKNKLERRKARQEAAAEYNVEEAHSRRSMLAIGVNAVSKALERQDVEAVIVSADVEPRLMAQHLIQLAVQQAAVIVAPGFRQLVKSTMGMESAAVAFKSCTKNEENLFHPAVQIIKNLAKQVPKPASYPDLISSQKEEEEVPIVDPDEEELQKWQNQEVRNWHLLRLASGKKAFYPPEDGEKTKMEDAGEFIPLGQDSDDIAVVSEYLPLRVKRVQPNKEKMARKKARKAANVK
ncbi:ribonuclease P protein subunit p38-like isoform X2 [Neocloeon triangulifer]|uniref:ribonuclease P protein subunit p38-like isoform X2 n=1 Tax=Neocloeon triangulifer TaxID=2078957 RepID=UPI00286EDF5F|nr:ribonuclease P protein subunit p38-like isoform X2 [Neocloeon triangulifer]